MTTTSAPPDLPALIVSLNSLIDYANHGEWDQAAALALEVSSVLSILQLATKQHFQNQANFPVDRETLKRIDRLIAVAAPLCQRRRDQIAPLISQLRPLQTPDGQ